MENRVYVRKKILPHAFVDSPFLRETETAPAFFFISIHYSSSENGILSFLAIQDADYQICSGKIHDT